MHWATNNLINIIAYPLYTLWRQCWNIRQLKCLLGRHRGSVVITHRENTWIWIQAAVWVLLVSLGFALLSLTITNNNKTNVQSLSRLLLINLIHVLYSVFVVPDSCWLSLISIDLEIQLTHSYSRSQCLTTTLKCIRSAITDNNSSDGKILAHLSSQHYIDGSNSPEYVMCGNIKSRKIYPKHTGVNQINYCVVW